MESGTTINRGNENLFDDASFFPFPFLHHQIRFLGVFSILFLAFLEADNVRKEMKDASRKEGKHKEMRLKKCSPQEINGVPKFIRHSCQLSDH